MHAFTASNQIPVIILAIYLVACNRQLKPESLQAFGVSARANKSLPAKKNCPEQIDNLLVSPIGSIDLLSYMLAPEALSQSGMMSKRGPDPDRSGQKTFFGYKFSNRGNYEVFHFDDQAIYLRYEVVKSAGWIRTFDEIDSRGSAKGALWAPRHILPGSTTALSTFALDRMDLEQQNWISNPSQSIKRAQNFLSFDWAFVDLGQCQAMKLLRMRQEWDATGNIFEHYDYGAGQGIMHWEWVERLEYLMTRPNGKPSQYVGFFDAGTDFVIEIDTQSFPPRATSINLGDQSRVPLPVYAAHSHRIDQKSWYVVTRSYPDQRSPLKESPRFPVDPGKDIQIGLGKTLIDLPHLYTTPAGVPNVVND